MAESMPIKMHTYQGEAYVEVSGFMDYFRNIPGMRTEAGQQFLDAIELELRRTAQSNYLAEMVLA